MSATPRLTIAPGFVQGTAKGGWLRPGDVDTEDAEDAFTVLAFDPGGTTGWSAFGVHKSAMRAESFPILDNILFWSAGQFSGPEFPQVFCMTALVEAWPLAGVVVEDFILRKFNMGRDLLAPVRVGDAFCYELWRVSEGRRYAVRQQPALAMTTITDERQHDIGMWIPGCPHANDAIKHGLTWLRRKKALLRKETS